VGLQGSSVGAEVVVVGVNLLSEDIGEDGESRQDPEAWDVVSEGM